jgi:erythromycin esterase-like protein
MARVLSRPATDDPTLIETVKRIAYPLDTDDLHSYDPLLDFIGDARIVLIGEASHGTHEFYRERARITTRLIEELGFTFVTIEGDWPEARQVDRFVTGSEGTARAVLDVFNVFPTWMWGNFDTLHFVEWLHRYNDALPADRPRVRFYGLDLYSLYASMKTVVEYLERIDPEAAKRARERYACFEPFSGNKDLYAYSAGMGLAESCEEEAVAMLRELQEKRTEYLGADGKDSYFEAVMSAEVARDSERYYRSMYRSDEISWNLRDIHMANTLDALLSHHGPTARAVVWEHNTHIGDFRATADADGMVNVGQLVRERHPGRSCSIGFGTYEGSVTAARGWGERPQHMTVPPAVMSSYDSVFHQTGVPRFLLLPPSDAEDAAGLHDWRGQRAIGVVYHPEYERGNYVPTRLAERYDAYIHIDRTRAVKPLAIEPEWVPAAMEETYPSGY